MTTVSTLPSAMSASSRWRAGRSVFPPREAAVVVAIGQAGPALLLLALDVGQARLTLGVQAVELLLQSLLGGLARVDGTADEREGPGRCRRSVHAFAPWLRQPLKKRKPLQCEPVMA